MDLRNIELSFTCTDEYNNAWCLTWTRKGDYIFFRFLRQVKSPAESPSGKTEWWDEFAASEADGIPIGDLELASLEHIEQELTLWVDAYRTASIPCASDCDLLVTNSEDKSEGELRFILQCRYNGEIIAEASLPRIRSVLPIGNPQHPAELRLIKEYLIFKAKQNGDVREDRV